LEEAEKLEQLRVLEQGETILVARVEEATRGIDTAADFAAFAAKFPARKLAG
jgi:CMP-2-keto-3-deoxyoctulosonic acid synthetase